MEKDEGSGKAKVFIYIGRSENIEQRVKLMVAG